MTTAVITAATPAAQIRSIGQLRILPPGTAAHFACPPCRATWSGSADCWSCGDPATTEYTTRDSALQLLALPPAPPLEAAS